jgi:hypothetical protein
MGPLQGSDIGIIGMRGVEVAITGIGTALGLPGAAPADVVAVCVVVAAVVVASVVVVAVVVAPCPEVVAVPESAVPFCANAKTGKNRKKIASRSFTLAV